jgi:hypothetical protein
LLASDLGIQQTKLINGGYVKALKASQTSVRGPHPQRLRMDEVDEVPKGIYEAALGQPQDDLVRKIDSHCCLSSTHQYQHGTMALALSEAAAKGWPIHEWCYKETLEPHGWLTKRALERKRQIMTAQSWEVEVLLQEPNEEGLAFDRGCLDAMFREDLGAYKGLPNEEVVIEPPVLGGLYATGADWAQTRDWTVISTFRIDVAPFRLVAYLKLGRIPWPIMEAAFDDRVARYRGPSCHDATGLGAPVADHLDADAEPFILTRGSKLALLTQYVLAVEHGELEAPMITSLASEHRHCTVAELYSVEHTPDSIISMAMALHAATEGRFHGSYR